MHRASAILILAAACSTPPEPADPPAASPESLPPILAQNAFLYYADLDEAEVFYRDVLGLSLAADFGFAKTFQVAESAYMTLVDEAEGMHSADEPKTVAFALITERLPIMASRSLIPAATSWSSNGSCRTPRTWT